MWPLSSRVHPLNTFPKGKASCYVKRDDELSCGISGTKLRKYSSIVPFLASEQIERLIIIAGPQSNNLLAALQIARELNLQVTAFLLKPHSSEIKGNFKLSLLFLNVEDIIWVDRSDWPQVEELAQSHLKQLEEKSFLLTEGASVPQAMSGAMTLAEDIIKNETDLGLQFKHIFIDAGTGFSAAGMIHGLAKLKHTALIHVLLLADSKPVFKIKLEQWLGYKPSNYKCYLPTTARSFGALNHTIKKEIKRLAMEEGILADPIYSAKLLYESRKYIELNKLEGALLIIHSGGALTMAGFDL